MKNRQVEADRRQTFSRPTVEREGQGDADLLRDPRQADPGGQQRPGIHTGSAGVAPEPKNGDSADSGLTVDGRVQQR